MGQRLDPNRPTVPEVIDRFRAYHAANPGGASLHIVIHDWNLEDGHVDFCIRDAEERGDGEGAALARILRQMSKTQRGKIADRCWER